MNYTVTIRDAKNNVEVIEGSFDIGNAWKYSGRSYLCREMRQLVSRLYPNNSNVNWVFCEFSLGNFYPGQTVTLINNDRKGVVCVSKTHNFANPDRGLGSVQVSHYINDMENTDDRPVAVMFVE